MVHFCVEAWIPVYSYLETRKEKAGQRAELGFPPLRWTVVMERGWRGP